MPSNTTSRVFFRVNVLGLLKNKKGFIEYTGSLKETLEEHNNEDAKRQEIYLKTFQGRKFLDLRLIEHKRTRAFGSGS